MAEAHYFQNLLCETTKALRSAIDDDYQSLPANLPKLEQLCGQLMSGAETETSALAAAGGWQCELTFARDWANLAWALLGVGAHIEQLLHRCTTIGLSDAACTVLLTRKQELLVRLVNSARPIPPPAGITDHPETAQLFQDFHEHFAALLHSLHTLYQRLTVTCAVDERQLESEIAGFGQRQLTACLAAFDRFSNAGAIHFWRRLRSAQLQHLNRRGPTPKQEIDRLTQFHSNLAYALGLLAARLDGFRHQTRSICGLLVDSDPIQTLMQAVYQTLNLTLIDSLLVGYTLIKQTDLVINISKDSMIFRLSSHRIMLYWSQTICLKYDASAFHKFSLATTLKFTLFPKTQLQKFRFVIFCIKQFYV